MIKVYSKNCPKNHICPAQRFCPVGAITQTNSRSAPTIDYDKCTDCGKCTYVCGVFKKA